MANIRAINIVARKGVSQRFIFKGKDTDRNLF